MKKLTSNLFSLVILILILVIQGCDNSEGLFGSSQTKEEAKANGSTVVEYVADKKSFNLIDGTKMQVDTAWTEISFTYHNGKRILDSSYGYLFSIPFKKEIAGSFTFSFSLADTTNRIFTNGIDDKLAQLCPRYLYDTIKVLLEQQDPDTSKGWTHPIITDTLTFIKIKN